MYHNIKYMQLTTDDNESLNCPNNDDLGPIYSALGPANRQDGPVYRYILYSIPTHYSIINNTYFLHATFS